MVFILSKQSLITMSRWYFLVSLYLAVVSVIFLLAFIFEAWAAWLSIFLSAGKEKLLPVLLSLAVLSLSIPRDGNL